MIQRELKIGRWLVDFLFMSDGYDLESIASCLYDAGASRLVFEQADDLLWMCDYNCGFTFANPDRFRAVVVIGPTTSGKEFLDTFVHEIRHLADAIAENLGLPLNGEGAAYLAGDTARELADVVCQLGCSHCR